MKECQQIIERSNQRRVVEIFLGASLLESVESHDGGIPSSGLDIAADIEHGRSRLGLRQSSDSRHRGEDEGR